VIDAEGRVAYKGGPGPRGFVVAEVPPVLDRLLAGLAAAPVRPADPARERLRGMLPRLGFTGEETAAILQSLDKKVDAYSKVVDARRGLLLALSRQEDPSKALETLDAAARTYARAADSIDRELDTSLGLSRDPRRRAALTGLGLLGSSPAGPLAAVQEIPAG